MNDQIFAQHMADMMGSMTIGTGIILACILLFLFGAVLVFTEKKRAIIQNAKKALRMNNLYASETYEIRSSRNTDFLLSFQEKKDITEKAKHETAFTLLSVLSSAVIIFALIILYTCIFTYKTAYLHGYRGDLWENPSGLWSGIKASPTEDKLPENTDSCLIILYKFGCDDCEKTYDALRSEFSETEKTYWIATRSKQGQDLVAKQQIASVPAAIYFQKDGNALTYTLYKNENGKTSINKTEIQNLKQAILYDRNQN